MAISPAPMPAPVATANRAVSPYTLRPRSPAQSPGVSVQPTVTQPELSGTVASLSSSPAGVSSSRPRRRSTSLSGSVGIANASSLSASPDVTITVVNGDNRMTFKPLAGLTPSSPGYLDGSLSAYQTALSPPNVCHADAVSGV